MPRLTVTGRGGEEHLIDAPPGVTIMEAIRDAGLDGLRVTIAPED